MQYLQYDDVVTNADELTSQGGRHFERIRFFQSSKISSQNNLIFLLTQDRIQP